MGFIEVWKDLDGYKGIYIISSYGNIKSCDRFIERSDGVIQFKKGKDLVRANNTDGYPTVHLSKDGKDTRVAVHRLVALNFISNPNNYSDVNHKDFNRENCRADNLEWVSHGDNVRYSIKAGRHFCNRDLHGENNPNYKSSTLKEFYKSNPEEKEKLARKGEQNGMCKKVSMIDINGNMISFKYIRECARYLIDNKISLAKNINAVADRITKSIKNNVDYCHCHFSFQ